MRKGRASPSCEGLQLFPSRLLPDTAGHCSAGSANAACPAAAAPRTPGIIYISLYLCLYYLYLLFVNDFGFIFIYYIYLHFYIIFLYILF